MNAISTLKNDSQIKKWVIGGSLIAAVCASIAFINKRTHVKSSALKLSEEQVYDILREFRKEFYPLLKNFASASKSIQSEYLARFGNQPQDIKEILFTHIVQENPNFEKSVENVELKVLARNSIEDPDCFRDLCRKYAKSNKKIEEIMREIKANFEKSVLGVVMPISLANPDLITKDTILEHFKDMTKIMSYKLANLTQKFRTLYGNSAFGTPEYQQEVNGIMSETSTDKYIDLYPSELTKDYHVQQIFIHGLTTFTRDDVKFRSKIESMEKKNQSIIKAIHLPECDYDSIFKDIDSFDYEEKEEPGYFYIDVVSKPVEEKIEEVNSQKDNTEENKNEEIKVESGMEVDQVTEDVKENDLEKIEGEQITEN